MSSSLKFCTDFSFLENQIRTLIEDLKSDLIETQRVATTEVLELTKRKQTSEIKLFIVICGAIKPLVSMLLSPDLKIQQNAVIILLNISSNPTNKFAISDAIEPLIYVLKTGSARARENSALLLESLSLVEEYRVKIGRSGAIKPLLELLATGDAIGKKYAFNALYELSKYPENKLMIDIEGKSCFKTSIEFN